MRLLRTMLPHQQRRELKAWRGGCRSCSNGKCIEQRNIEFVREEFERRRNRWCGGPLLNEGSRGDCEQNSDLQGVSWTVITSTQAELVVSMNWPVGLTPEQPLGPPPGRLDCSVSVPENLGTQLRDAANFLVESEPLAFGTKSRLGL